MIVKSAAALSLLLLCCSLAVSQKIAQPDNLPMAYEDCRGQIEEPDILVLRSVSGKVFFENPHTKEVEAEAGAGARLGLFTEDGKRLVKVAVADDKGVFRFGRVPPGLYRLVVRPESNIFNVGNGLVRVMRQTRRRILKNRSLVIRLSVLSIHGCSPIESA